MHSFTDGKGRSWEIVVDVAAIEEIQEQTGIDFGEPGAFERAFGDTKTFAGVLWCLLAERAKELGLTPRQVKQGLDTADVVAAARDAVAEELIRFFPKAAGTLRRLEEVLTEREAVIQQRAQGQVDRLVEEIRAGNLDRLLLPGPDRAAAIAEMTTSLRDAVSGSSNSATGSAASPALTPAG